MNCVKVDIDRCQGHAKCVLVAADLFELNNQGQAVYIGPPGPLDEATAMLAIRAVESCPEEAIAVEIDGGPAIGTTASRTLAVSIAGQRLHLRCPCGEMLMAADEDALVAAANSHLAAIHPHLAAYTREQILVMAY